MAITTKLATRYWLKTIVMAVVCIVLGLWGVWDYTVAIPEREQAANRSLVLKVVNTALATERGSAERDKAAVRIALSLKNDVTKPTEESSSKQWDLDNTAGWIKSLKLFQAAVSGGDLETQEQAAVVIEDGLNQYGSVTPPSKYDRPMQWMFILCLPFSFYYLFKYFQMTKRAKTYCLDDEGRLTTPEGSWAADEILDIDMSTWISKTAKARTTWVARVTVSGREPIVLDDYVYQDMYLIIGKLANLYYPSEWTPLARRITESKNNNVEEEK